MGSGKIANRASRRGANMTALQRRYFGKRHERHSRADGKYFNHDTHSAGFRTKFALNDRPQVNDYVLFRGRLGPEI